MSSAPRVPIVNVGYRSTNYWVVGGGGSRLLVDLGWPGTMGTLRAELARKGVPFDELRYGLATHYHLDHAGLAQELKLAGLPLLVVDLQLEAIPRMKRHAKPADRFVDIATHDNVMVSCAASRALLATIGLAGEIVHTPGHSDDSVSLLLDDGAVFTGDLTSPARIADASDAAFASWKALLGRGATQVYPGHGNARPLSETVVELPHGE